MTTNGQGGARRWLEIGPRIHGWHQNSYNWWRLIGINTNEAIHDSQTSEGSASGWWYLTRTPLELVKHHAMEVCIVRVHHELGQWWIASPPVRMIEGGYITNKGSFTCVQKKSWQWASRTRYYEGSIIRFKVGTSLQLAKQSLHHQKWWFIFWRLDYVSQDLILPRIGA